MFITRINPFTGELNTRFIEVTQEQVDAWNNGMMIQDAMPNVSADDREFIKTGITDWDDFYAEQQPGASAPFQLA